MNVVFYISAAIALICTVLVITRWNAVHALLYLIVSLLALAVTFYTLGAPFVAALEVIIYAGAIMVLFIFVIMMLNLGPAAAKQEQRQANLRQWLLPGLFVLILIGEVLYIAAFSRGDVTGPRPVSPKEVGITMLGTYLIGVELSSLVLLAGLIGAYHLGRRQRGAEPGEGES